MRGLLATLTAVALAAALAAPATAAPAAAPPAANDTLRVTLDDAVARALAGSPEARAARAGVGIANGQVVQARAAALPQVTGTVTYDRRFASIYQGLASDSGIGSLFAHSAFAAVHTWTADVTAHQTLWAAGRVGAGLSAARSVRDAALATRDESLADLALTVRAAYLDAAHARRLQAIAEEGLEQARAHLAQVKLFRAQGSRSEYELLQAQVDAANQEPAVVAARNAVGQALLQLRRLMNVPLDRPVELVTPLEFADGRVPVLASASTDGMKRPALRGAEDMVDARRQALRAERANRWPELSASATLSHQAFPTDFVPHRHDFATAADGSVQLTWPIFQGLRTFGAVQAAQGELVRAEADRDRARQSIALEVEQARHDVREALAAFAARRGTADLARRAHHLATVRWQNGLSTQLEVSDARLRLQTAETNEVAAIKDYRLALLRLERATGAPLDLALVPIDQLPDLVPTDGAH